MEIYIRRGEEQFGPLTPEQLQESLNNGTLQADDLAWHSELPDWVSAGELLQMVVGGAPEPVPTPVAASSTVDKGMDVAAASGSRKKLLIAAAAVVVLVGGVAAAFFAGVFGGDEEPVIDNPPAVAGGGSGTGGDENTSGAGNPEGTVNPPDPAPAPAGGGSTSFAAVTQKLDSGGSLYFYLSTGQAQDWVQSVFTEGGSLLQQMGPVISEPAQAEMALGIGQAVYSGLGLDSIDGMGASTKDIGDGLKRNVAVVHRDPANGEGLIWKAFGTAPHELGALKLMPADTAYAMHGDLNVTTVLQWVQQMTTQHAPPDMAAELNGQLQNPLLQAVLNGYAGEMGVYLTLDTEKTVPVPLGGVAMGEEDFPAAVAQDHLKELGEVTEIDPVEDTIPIPLPGISPVPGLPEPGVVPPPAGIPVPPLPGGTAVPLPLPNGDLEGGEGMVNIPEPGLVLVLKVKDDSIEKMIEGAAGAQVPLQALAEGEVTIKQAPAPLPLPFPVPVQPAMCQVGEYLIVATSPELAKKVIAVHSGQDSGLQGTPEFQKLARGMDLEGNQFIFMGDRMGQMYEQVMKQMLSSAGNDIPPPVEKMVLKIMTMGVSASVTIGKMESDGMMIQSHTTGMGYDTMAMMGAAAVPLAGFGMSMAGMVLPAISSASDSAQEVVKMNNAKQLGISFFEYNDVQGQLPKAETWCDELIKFDIEPSMFSDPIFEETKESPDEKVCIWLFNRNLSGVKIEDIKDPANTVLIYDGGLDWNGAAGKEEFFPDANFKVTTVFADGHVEQIGPQEAARLKWTP